jgi:hypothetical protein
MSATCRGAKRHGADFYATPESAFKPLLPFINAIGEEVWEPACGDGRLIKWIRETGAWAEGDDPSRGFKYNFLGDESRRGCIITNPPFSLALEFCDHAIEHAPNVFMLLRLNFLASRKRRDWWNSHNPSALFVLSERPSFTDNGKTDATDYAWFYWGKIHKGFYFL